MRSYPRARAPLRILLVRALVGYPLLRALVAMVSALLGFIAGADTAGALESPLGVVLLAMALGAVDVRRRGETLLWANLGYPAWVAPGIVGAVALLGELALAWART